MIIILGSSFGLVALILVGCYFKEIVFGKQQDSEDVFIPDPEIDRD